MRIGVLGAARITPKSLLEPAGQVEGVEVAAVAARDVARAEAFAAEHGIPTVHPSYRALVEDGSLDAVYVALPASLHAEWSIAAVEAGRHVLCEKPFAANAAEAREMVAAAERADRRLVEAFHWRFHPVAARVVELAREIGPLEHGEGHFDAAIPPSDIRYVRGLGGGATMDLGCYPIHWVRTVTGEEPEVVRAEATEGPPGIDVTMEAELVFASGLDAVIRCSMAAGSASLPDAAFLDLHGRNGTLHVLNPMAPQFGHRIEATLADGRQVHETIEAGTSYLHQLRSFVRVLAGEEEPITGGADAIANMATIDAIYTAAGLGPRP
ncbi:MAG TPA: Gfo/Idh/MocA family oxidoreductase [Acidimicrobiales bacterium]|nr:Gfo/Idh/MocA family oxidoreductase [Acidimicrobiales bacterium]